MVWSTPNLNNLVASQTDARFREMLSLSDLSTVDGMPLVLLARVLGIPISERVAGSSVFDHLMSEERASIGVYFFGGTDAIVRQASKRLNSLSRHMRCVGFFAPGFGSIESMSSEEILSQINAVRPDMLVLALGTQRGHEWIRLNGHRLNVPLLSHLGSVINFAAGTVTRAPRWMQVLGLEWLWRIIEEPHLAPRYANDFVGLLRIVWSKLLPAVFLRILAGISGESRVTAQLNVDIASAEMILRLKGAWHGRDLQPLRDALSDAAVRGLNLRFEVSDLTHATPELLGLLLVARGHQARSGLSFSVAAASRWITKLFRFNGVEHLLNTE
ncbi:WecB/TagA/CpsF family glycosyltransferase [Bradyrhizobium sp. USDA 4486]